MVNPLSLTTIQANQLWFGYEELKTHHSHLKNQALPRIMGSNDIFLLVRLDSRRAIQQPGQSNAACPKKHQPEVDDADSQLESCADSLYYPV